MVLSGARDLQRATHHRGDLLPPLTESAVRHVVEPDPQRVAGESFAEMRHVETDRVVVRSGPGREVDGPPRRKPRLVEDQGRDLKEEVAVRRAAAVHNGADAFALDEHVAV